MQYVAKYVACFGKLRNAYNTPIRKPDEERHLGRSRCRWQEDIKGDL
jgi:hypothetical protein